jgi:hypothetical protein
VNDTPDENKRRQIRCPWWISILLAILTYTSMNYLLPNLALTNQTLSNLCKMGPDLAPIPTILFLLLGAKQLYDDVEPETKTQPDDNE